MAMGKSKVANAALQAEKALHSCSPRCNRPPRANPNPERAEVRHTAFTGCLRPYRGQVRFTVTAPCSQLNGYPPRPVNAYSPRNGGGPRWGLPGPARGAGGRGVPFAARTGEANRLSALRRKFRRRPGPEPAGPPPLEFGGPATSSRGPSGPRSPSRDCWTAPRFAGTPTTTRPGTRSSQAFTDSARHGDTSPESFSFTRLRHNSR